MARDSSRILPRALNRAPFATLAPDGSVAGPHMRRKQLDLSASRPPDDAVPQATVLLVEDQEAVAMAACRILARAGYTVLTARDGAEALAILEAPGARVNVVVTDLTMPKMGGAELVRRLTILDPDLPVVYMSGFAEENTVPELTRHTFLQKPFTIEALTGAVRAALDRSA